MGNCLKTQLKESVNAELPIFETIVIKVKKASDTVTSNMSSLRLNCNQPITVKPVGGHLWTNAGDFGDETKWTDEEIIVTPSTVNPRTYGTYLWAENKDFKIEVKAKYDINTLFIGTGSANESILQVPEFSELKYLPLQILYLGYSWNGSGNVKDIPMDNLKELNLVACRNVVGSISDINSTQLLDLSLYASGVTGSVDDFVSAQCDAGRTSIAYDSPIAVKAILNTRSFAGKIYNLGSIVEEMYWDGKNKIAIYYGGTYSDNTFTHVYVKGFTAADSEVVAWKAAGKTVIDAATGNEL